jgi:hypothetical protein
MRLGFAGHGACCLGGLPDFERRVRSRPAQTPKRSCVLLLLPPFDGDWASDAKDGGLGSFTFMVDAAVRRSTLWRAPQR